MYDEMIVAPMREELTRLGVQETKTAAEVDKVLGDKKGTVLLVVNSVCGCAAGNARPAVAMALENSSLPDKMITVFAGILRRVVGQNGLQRRPAPGFPRASAPQRGFRMRFLRESDRQVERITSQVREGPKSTQGPLLGAGPGLWSGM